MPIQKQFNKGRVPVKVWAAEIEPAALRQLLHVADLPIVHGHVAVMPDVHAGIGATVGSVIPTRAAIIPAAVGVDIGCGMNAVRLSLSADQPPDGLGRLRGAIEAAVPVGFAQHPLDKVQGSAHGRQARPLADRLDRIVGRHPALMKMQRQFPRTWIAQMGTLGGGNHFIELCLDETGQVWVRLHSGSRGIGNCMGRYFIAAARKQAQQAQWHLPDQDLTWLADGSPWFDDYCEAVAWAQDYALLNRRMMLELILEALRPNLPSFRVVGEAINCHHNYAAREVPGARLCSLPARAPSPPRRASWASSPAVWGRKATSCAGKATRPPFAPVPTAPAGA